MATILKPNSQNDDRSGVTPSHDANEASPTTNDASASSDHDAPTKSARNDQPSDLVTAGTTGVVSRIPGGVAGLANFNLDDFAKSSLAQLERCRSHIEAMLSQARLDAEQICNDAKSQGYDDGKAAAQEDFTAQVNQAAESKAKSQLNSLENAVAAMQTQYQAWMDAFSQTLPEMIIAATERIVMTQLESERPLVHDDTESQKPVPDSALTSETSPTTQALDNEPSLSINDGLNRNTIVRWAHEAVHSTRSSQRLTLAVNPETLAEIGELLDELLANPDLPESSTVIPDPSLKLGDVRVRQDGGEIRAGLMAQLDRLREVLA
ncbi:MAG: FliH/SctL family protein [Planctomycetota bacterium]